MTPLDCAAGRHRFKDGRCPVCWVTREDAHKTCACEYPYLGAQLAGTPTRCERCRGLVTP